MNKRQRKKQMTKVFRRLARPAVWKALGEVGAEFIRAQLAKPSIGNILLTTVILEPKLDPPFRRWADENNIVHWTGVNVRDKHDDRGPFEDRTTMRLCDFEEVDDDRMVMANEVVTCVRCQTYDERMRRP